MSGSRIYRERLPAKDKINVPPDPARLVGALRAIGYRFEQAISDLVDNSINANAKHVVIRFITDRDSIRAVAIADDGTGMDEDTISEAMRFGSKDIYEESSLGKYGMGLKLASMSHAKVLTVVSRRAGISVGRRWTPEGIANDWAVDILGSEDFRYTLDEPWQKLDLSDSGTIVIWKEIDRIRIYKNGLKATINSFKARLRKHLGLTFHRFIEDGRLTILVDDQSIDGLEKDNYLEIPALNPFGFSAWPSDDYPRNFNADLDGIGRLSMKAYICPPNSKAPEYKLGGNAAARQGFYFYRNDRLIQAGGWNSLVESEAEPHGSLARVKVDLPAMMDGDFGLNVQKSAVITPASFVTGVQGSASAQNVSFDDFRRTADEIYRKTDEGAVDRAPMIPAGQVPTQISDLAKRWFREKGGKFRSIEMQWAQLDGPEIYVIDPKKNSIILNSRYRKLILGSRRRSKQDVPLFKVTLFFLLKDYFRKKRLSKKDKEAMEAMEEVIRAAAKKGKG